MRIIFVLIQEIIITYLLQHPFTFQTNANSAGVIQLHREFEIPLTGVIRVLAVETTNQCHDRIHHVKITINDQLYAELNFKDCNRIEFSNSFEVDRGTVTIALFVDNFNSDERVEGVGIVDYDIHLF